MDTRPYDDTFEIAWLITETLTCCSVQADQIGVFGTTKHLLRKLNDSFSSHDSPVDVLTFDRSQGQDKDCAIVCLPNDSKDIAQWWPKATSCFTRSRCKLIVIGFRNVLKECDASRLFLDFIDQRQWTIQLPTEALSAVNRGKRIAVTSSSSPRVTKVHVGSTSEKALAAIGSTTRDIMDDMK